MVKERCLSRTSLGITRSFPRLYPTMGLVTVALLTLAPLALRPVRLACLIHAANVHSEPGSNPSKWCRPRRRLCQRRCQPSPRKVEEKIGRTKPRAMKHDCFVPWACCRLAKPSLCLRDRSTTSIVASRKRRLARRLPSRVPHNATDEGSKKNPHQSRLSALFCFSFSG